MIQLEVRKIGNSLGVVLPKEVVLHGYAFTAAQALATHAVLDLAALRTGLDGYERFGREHVLPAPSS
jgi:hypothetical protein